ncbi:hypothetical protein ACFYR1_43905 [Streptomyces canus]|uniref:hypothetical protein n=1 Tax=Streptomyces canus TaxID=58343 RepID=UPI00368BAB8E
MSADEQTDAGSYEGITLVSASGLLTGSTGEVHDPRRRRLREGAVGDRSTAVRQPPAP